MASESVFTCQNQELVPVESALSLTPESLQQLGKLLIQSSDKKQYLVDKQVAMDGSGFFRRLFQDRDPEETIRFAETQTNIIDLHNISGQLLEVVIKFLCYKAQNRPELDFVVDPEQIAELLLVADFLDI